MIAKIIRIGNSQGIRIPKPLLEQSGLKEEVELKIEDNQLIIRPLSNPREGWDKAFKMMAKKHDDSLLDDELNLTNWEKTEWEWK
ncbi:MAG: AbrB/MazE/SpoVT family DNA-binding domain-containing protein [SAR324 cluster bacterium]|nr:AbrB/MazE/SpoVT family DNA-binding domain-containing protein [SAR324 cluster bacterium]